MEPLTEHWENSRWFRWLYLGFFWSFWLAWAVKMAEIYIFTLTDLLLAILILAAARFGYWLIERAADLICKIVYG